MMNTVTGKRWRWHGPEPRGRRIAWLLPAGVVYWCAIRVVAHATTGIYGGTVVPDLTAMDALKRWESHLKENQS
jgi:hypothetical protein